MNVFDTLLSKALMIYALIVVATSGANTATTVTDADGNKYTTVKIGTQIWTVENLKTTKYNDGTPIPHASSREEWCAADSTNKPAYCSFDYNDSNRIKFGAMYNWHVVGTGKLAPKGWHIPTDAEWTKLQEYLIANGYNYNGTKKGNLIAKSLASKTGWESHDSVGTIGNDPESNNRTGFSALPGGECSYSGKFYGAGRNCFWWSATGVSPTNADTRSLNYSLQHLDMAGSLKGCGCFVRLLKDK